MFDPWVRKILWRRDWQPTPVFLPGEFHGQRSLAGSIVHGVAKSWTQLSVTHSLKSHPVDNLETEMAKVLLQDLSRRVPGVLV